MLTCATNRSAAATPSHSVFDVVSYQPLWITASVSSVSLLSLGSLVSLRTTYPLPCFTLFDEAFHFSLGIG